MPRYRPIKRVKITKTHTHAINRAGTKAQRFYEGETYDAVDDGMALAFGHMVAMNWAVEVEKGKSPHAEEEAQAPVEETTEEKEPEPEPEPEEEPEEEPVPHLTLSRRGRKKKDLGAPPENKSEE